VNKELSANTTLSHYRIVSKIGAGGMGEVYLAQDTKLDRKVALKILPADLAANQDRMRRFVQEAKAAAALNHPNIAHIYEIGESEGTNFIAMEFVDGVTLTQKIHQEQSELGKLLRCLQHVAEGLAKAHAAGIVHRDLKPDNIMITRDGHAKVLDFGLAKLIEPQPPAGLNNASTGEDATAILQQQSIPGMIMGTVGYMSPEQAQGKTNEIDQRSDIFSFGCILYEAVTGHKAFAGKDVVDSLNKIIREQVTPVSDFRPDAPNHLQRIVRRCLAKDPEDRYQTIKDVAIELRELRHELAAEGDLDVTVTPATASNAAGETRTSEAARQTAGNSTSGMQSSLAPGASSAEYILSRFKEHKFGVVIALLILVGAAVGFGVYLSSQTTRATIESIAVMPFVNESGNAEVEYLSDGMTETLIKSLSQLPNLAVKSRSAVFYYKGKETSPKKIGEELGVQAVLLGRVVQRGEDLKLNLELVNTKTQDVIWSEQYARKPSDLVSLQSEIARDVSTKLKAKLSGVDEAKVTNTSTANPEAYQAYLKGRYYWNRRTAENLKKAIEQFKIATDRDPNYALAYAGLADCYAVLHEYAGAPTSETAPQAKAYAERALALDAQLAEPHATLGTVNENLWHWGDAEKEFKRAIEQNPNYPTAYHWYSIFLKDLGRNDEAASTIKRAQQLDPLSSVIAVNISRLYQLQNNHAASIENSLKIIELDPSFGPAYEYLALSYLKQGKNADAIAAMEKAAELNNRSGIVLGDLGYVYAATEKKAEAIAVIKELEAKYERKEAIGQFIAAVYIGLGEKDKVFAWLEKDFEARNGKLGEVRWQVQFETLRDDPRFKDLLKRMGLPE
jgi:serine/threonine protein kinase/tetratricopeptide (TPR) repeat protein